MRWQSGRIKFVPAIVLVALLHLSLAACAPTPPAGQQPAERAAPAPATPQRRLVILIRAEVPSLAAKPLAPYSGSLSPPIRFFNAMLDFIDEKEASHPYLAEALPQLNTDTWRVFPDGRMESVHRLRPNLTWHDGTPLSVEDFVFALKVYSAPAWDSAHQADKPDGRDRGGRPPHGGHQMAAAVPGGRPDGCGLPGAASTPPRAAL